MKANPPQPNSDSWQESSTELHEQLLASLGEKVVLAPERTRRVFVNRNLRMDQIEVIGFDMDYTLALYNQPRLEALSAACTLDKMIARRGYPESLRQLPYDARLAIRGLVVDRDRE